MPLLKTLVRLLQHYAEWLHLRWPSGKPEPLSATGESGATSIPGVRIAGDLLGIPLLKFAADSGAKAVRAFIAEGAFGASQNEHEMLDLAIIGGGVAGLSAALEAKSSGLKFAIYEADQPFSTVSHFTRGKPIFTYPKAMRPEGQLELNAGNKEDLLMQLHRQADQAGIKHEIRRVNRVIRKGGQLRVVFDDVRPAVKARRVLICTGRNGDHYKLNVPGEELDKVHNRLFDADDYAGRKVLVVGGGDSALEAAISLHEAGADVSMSYRGESFTRPKPENIEKALFLFGKSIFFNSRVKAIDKERVNLSVGGYVKYELPNDDVFVFIGRQAPVDFFRRSGIKIRGHWSIKQSLSLLAVLVSVLLVYRWKTENSEVADLFLEKEWFPFNIDATAWTGVLGFGDLLTTQSNSPGFYYELAYTLIIVLFGLRRMGRNSTPYIRKQTLSLMLFQILPLFLLPYFLLPLMGGWGWFDGGVGKWLADQLFPFSLSGDTREYWRSVGFILAWPLFIWNVFTPAPNALWLSIAFTQTFILIPLLVKRYGKGFYCGWICSCGALAETLGNAHRSKMPHGPFWNRMNMAGQLILILVFFLLFIKLLAWGLADVSAGKTLGSWFDRLAFEYRIFGVPLSYSHVVDYFLSGILGLGLYFHFSGRTWCRFFCPLAALMHIYARFSEFRIFAEKAKCISCNVCTSVCHQGIDVMSFAKQGKPMADPQCVRCSACVYHCPTGTLSFGRLTVEGKIVTDRLPASPVQIRETLNRTKA